VQRAPWHHVDVLWAAAQVPVLVREVREPPRGGGPLRRVVTPGHAGVVGARWAVPGGQRLSWAAEARAAGGTWVITAH
jgi:hypothetical protein